MLAVRQLLFHLPEACNPGKVMQLISDPAEGLVALEAVSVLVAATDECFIRFGVWAGGPKWSTSTMEIVEATYRSFHYSRQRVALHLMSSHCVAP